MIAQAARPVRWRPGDCFRGRACAGARGSKLGGGSRAKPMLVAWASPMTPIQRSYPRVIRVRGVVESVAQRVAAHVLDQCRAAGVGAGVGVHPLAGAVIEGGC